MINMETVVDYATQTMTVFMQDVTVQGRTNRNCINYSENNSISKEGGRSRAFHLQNESEIAEL